MSSCHNAPPAVRQVVGGRYEECDDPRAKAAWQKAQQDLRDNRPGAAVAALATCVELCPRNATYHILYQDTAHALPKVKEAGNDAPARATRAMRRFYERYPDDGKSPLPHFLRARLERLDGRHAPCQTCLMEALARDPRFYPAHYEYALMWRAVDKPDKAAVHLRKALALRPKLVAAHRDLADVYRELGEWGGAVQQYEAYLAAQPSDQRARREYLSLIIYKVEGRIDAAARLVRELLAENEGDLSLQMDQAAVYLQQGQLDRAVQAYREVLRRDHTRARAALNLGNLYFDKGQNANPGSPQARDALRKARTAYRFFCSLEEFADAYDWFDLKFSVPARLRRIDGVLGKGSSQPVTWRDL